jgi:peptide chain release factor 1
MLSFSAQADKITNRFQELEQILADPQTLKDLALYRRLSREHSRLSEAMTHIKEYQLLGRQIADVANIIAEDVDKELVELAHKERPDLSSRTLHLETLIQDLLIPDDPSDQKNVILEIRAGTGGDEAALFARDLFEMYQRYSERARWKLEVLSSNTNEAGGFKEIIATISGSGVYGKIKYESGVHRVQRVPATETQGRIHTSAASVVVLPEAEDVEMSINESDLRIDTYRAGGAGGQHVNKTESAIRITHIPTGVVVICQDERSQLKNKHKALKVLKSRLLDLRQQEKERENSSSRRTMIKSGDRSDKIRTYNFHQNRVTDHRIDLTLYRLPEILSGDLDQLLQALAKAEKNIQLEQLESAS